MIAVVSTPITPLLLLALLLISLLLLLVAAAAGLDIVVVVDIGVGVVGTVGVEILEGVGGDFAGMVAFSSLARARNIRRTGGTSVWRPCNPYNALHTKGPVR